MRNRREVPCYILKGKKIYVLIIGGACLIVRMVSLIVVLKANQSDCLKHHCVTNWMLRMRRLI